MLWVNLCICVYICICVYVYFGTIHVSVLSANEFIKSSGDIASHLEKCEEPSSCNYLVHPGEAVWVPPGCPYAVVGLCGAYNAKSKKMTWPAATGKKCSENYVAYELVPLMHIECGSPDLTRTLVSRLKLAEPYVPGSMKKDESWASLHSTLAQ